MEIEASKDAFSNLLDIIFTRKTILAIGFFCVFIVVAIGVFFMSPTYEASTKIYITLPAIPKEEIPYLSDLRSIRSFIPNQKEIIRSRIIYEKAARELNLHKVEKVPSFLSKFKKMLFPLNANAQAKIDPLEDAINDLFESTYVNLIRNTHIIEIYAYSNSAEQSAKIANTIAEIYIEYTNSQLFRKTQSAYDFISVELDYARENLTRSLKALNEYKDRESVISLIAIADELSLARKRIDEYELQYQQVQEEIYEIEDQLLGRNINDVNVKAEELFQIKSYDSPKIIRLKTRLKELKKDYAATLQKYTDNYPGVVDLRSQITNLEKEISNEMGFSSGMQSSSQQNILKNRLEKLKNKKDDLFEKIQGLKDSQRTLSITESELTTLTRDVNNKEKQYLMTKEKLENARILKASEMEEGSIRILDPASPPLFPKNKKKKILLAVGFLASILFGLGMAFIAEYRDDSLKSYEDVEEYLKLPVLATIPPITKKVQKNEFNGKPQKR